MEAMMMLSAWLIRVSLVCQGFTGFHQRHIRILSHDMSHVVKEDGSGELG